MTERQPVLNIVGDLIALGPWERDHPLRVQALAMTTTSMAALADEFESPVLGSILFQDGPR